MPYAHVRGIDLYYEERGEGPPLIFAHGLMGSIELNRSFGENVDAIAERGVRVIAYDARGHGRSGYTTQRADYRWSALAEDMFGLIRALDLERASVYGGSMGAGTALALALADPDAVEKLILRAPPPFGEQAAEARRMFGGLAVLYRLMGSRRAARLLMLLPQVRAAQRATPKLDLRHFFASQRRASIVPAIRGVLYDERLPVERFGEITQPALILTHPGDAIHPEASGRILHERMLHARLAAAPSRAYWQEHADELAEVVASFVRGGVRQEVGPEMREAGSATFES
jgi:pimeloyl-ACP methyl ester carboxylesterase